MDLATFRPLVDAWITRQFLGASFVAAGGQRLVYKVPTSTGPAALKVWPQTDVVQHERHVREVSALARLVHPGLATVRQHLSQVDLGGVVAAFYVEQWLDAQSMRLLLDGGGLPLSGPDAKSFLCSSLEVLQALHAEDIVHRDISLGNVLWDGSQAFIIDLGLAKHLGASELTATGVQLPLTATSASPEQLEGVAGDLRSSTDIFSLAVVSWIATTGTHPFLRPTDSVGVMELVQRQRSGDILGDAGALEAILRRMLNPGVLMRPSSPVLIGELAC